MKKIVSTWLLCSSALALALSVVTLGQAADTPSVPTKPADGAPAGRPALRGPLALGPFSIFDTNHDGVLSADEIDAAPAALRKLDKDGDGKLTAAELRPHGPPPPRRDRDKSDSDGDMPPPPPPEQ